MQGPIRKREFGQSDSRVPPQVRASVTSTKPCGMFAVAGLCRSVNNSTQLYPVSSRATAHRIAVVWTGQVSLSVPIRSSMKTGNTYPRAPPPTRSTHSRAFTTRHDVATDTTRTQTRTSTRATHATSTCTSHARSPPAPLAAASRRLEVEAVPPHQRLMGRGRHLNSNGALPVASSSKPRSPRARLQCMGG